jgi:hypothetical protein
MYHITVLEWIGIKKILLQNKKIMVDRGGEVMLKKSRWILL